MDHHVPKCGLRWLIELTKQSRSEIITHKMKTKTKREVKYSLVVGDGTECGPIFNYRTAMMWRKQFGHGIRKVTTTTITETVFERKK